MGKNVVYRCDDYNDNNDDYDKSDNNMEYSDSSDDDNDVDDTRSVSKNDDHKYRQTKHQIRNVKGKNINKKTNS